MFDTLPQLAGYNRSPDRSFATRPSLSSILFAMGLLLWLAPAGLSLAANVWVTEAGSIAPLTLCLGAWVLWRTWHANAAVSRSGSSPFAWIALVIIGATYLFAAAIAMPSLLALAAWSGGLVVFYVRCGATTTRRCLVPWLLLLLVVPLPFALSLDLNVILRRELSVAAVALASWLGMNAALEWHFIIVGPYVLAVENACAGANSTITLVTLALLYGFWTGSGRWAWILLFALLAVPVAMVANVIRIVLLMASVDLAGAAILETSWHPIAGLVSFGIACLLLFAIDAMLHAGRRFTAIRRFGRS